MPAIEDAKILILATDGFEQSELEVPRDKLREKGATVHVATLDGDAIKGWVQDDWGDSAEADLKLEDAEVGDYHALVLPGGQINPDVLRATPEAVDLVRNFAAHGRVVAAICHAPWLLIEAGIVKGRTMTSFKSIRTDLKNAGATVVDTAVACDEHIITSRSPEDLNDFVGKIVEEIEAAGTGQAAA